MSVLAPVLIFFGLQLHRHIILSWSIEFLLTLALMYPYLEPTKKTREIGIQTDSEVVTLGTKKRISMNKVIMMAGLSMLFIFYFF